MRNLTELSLLTAGAGILMLLALSFYQPAVEVSELEKYVGGVVNAKGVVTGVRNSTHGHVFITISDGKSKAVVPIFNTSAEGLDAGCLERGVELRVRGRVEWYVYRRGKETVRQLEVIPERGGDVSC